MSECLELHGPSETTSQHSDEWKFSPIFKDYECSEWLRYSKRSHSYKVVGTGRWMGTAGAQEAARGRVGCPPRAASTAGGTQPPRTILGTLGSDLCQVLMALDSGTTEMLQGKPM